MPLYEYKCRKCGHRFEKIESVNSSTTKKCPKCGATSDRLLAAPAIQFKGSGWYVTDYAGKNAAKSSGEASDGAAAEKKSGESKGTESKSSDTKAEKSSEKKAKK